MRRFPHHISNKMSFAGVVGTRTIHDHNSPSLSEFNNDATLKPRSKFFDADTLDAMTGGQYHGSDNKSIKSIDSSESFSTFAPFITTYATPQQKQKQLHQPDPGTTPSANRRPKYDDTTSQPAAGRHTKSKNKMQLAARSPHRQQPLTTTQFQNWSASICSTPQSAPRTRSPARPSQTNDINNTSIDGGTTGKMRREHLQVAGDAPMSKDANPDELLFPTHTHNPPDSHQLRASIDRGRSFVATSPWHLPTAEYGLPRQAFVERFRRNSDPSKIRSQRELNTLKMYHGYTMRDHIYQFNPEQPQPRWR